MIEATAEQKWKYLVVQEAASGDYTIKFNTHITPEQCESLYEELESDVVYEIENYFIADGKVVTNIVRRDMNSRHYNSREVAANTPWGWVGWTYWYGGGKHGEPEAMDKKPYNLKVTKEEEVITINRVFEEGSE